MVQDGPTPTAPRGGPPARLPGRKGRYISMESTAAPALSGATQEILASSAADQGLTNCAIAFPVRDGTLHLSQDQPGFRQVPMPPKAWRHLTTNPAPKVQVGAR